MKTLTTLILALVVTGVMGQTTIPIKNKALIDKITTYRRKGIIDHYDYLILLTTNGNGATAWANKYRGKWYSNYPYTVKFYYNQHIIKCYDMGVFVTAFTATTGYQWFNKKYFKAK